MAHTMNRVQKEYFETRDICLDIFTSEIINSIDVDNVNTHFTYIRNPQPYMVNIQTTPDEIQGRPYHVPFLRTKFLELSRKQIQYALGKELGPHGYWVTIQSRNNSHRLRITKFRD